LGRLEQRAWLDPASGGDPARFDYLSARPSNPASQVHRSRAVTFLRFRPMQRTSDEVEDRRDVGEWVDVSELVARISAERGLPVEDTGRHRLGAAPDARR